MTIVIVVVVVVVAAAVVYATGLVIIFMLFFRNKHQGLCLYFTEKIYRQKKHDVAWFVSQCNRPSRRMEYVRRMMKRVDVHIYGRCGNYTCGKKGYTMGAKKTECLDLLTKNYKSVSELQKNNN